MLLKEEVLAPYPSRAARRPLLVAAVPVAEQVEQVEVEVEQVEQVVEVEQVEQVEMKAGV
jgi:hypothetical protein